MSSERDPAGHDTLCVLPWVHLEVMPQGVCKICCVAQEQVHANRVPLNVAGFSLEQIRSSGYMKNVRASLGDGRRIPACAHCWHQEDRGEQSPRQLWNGRYPEAAALIAERVRLGLDVSQPLPVQYIQVSLGNKCNLSCRMCNSSYSSRIAEDPVHSKWAPPAEIPGAGSGDETATRPGWDPALPWFEQDAFLRGDLLTSGSSLGLLTVTGGEPLLSDAFARLLEEYVAAGHGRTLAIRLNSNLFHNEDRIRKVMRSLVRFWYCSIGVSVDGFGPVYDYVRYPARWRITERNIRLVRELSRETPSLLLSLDTVVQPYNCLSVVDLMRFADELQIECNAHVIEQPWFLSMQVVPRELRLRAAERLQAYGTTPGAAGTQTTNRQHALRIARHFEMMLDDERTPAARTHFVDFTRALDASRKQDLRACVPELAEALMAEPAAAAAPLEPPAPRRPRTFLASLQSLFR